MVLSYLCKALIYNKIIKLGKGMMACHSLALISSATPSFHYGVQGVRNLPPFPPLPRHSDKGGTLYLLRYERPGITAQRGSLYLREEICALTVTTHVPLGEGSSLRSCLRYHFGGQAE